MPEKNATRDTGTRIMERCDALAALSEESGALTRTFGSAQHRQALTLIRGWMKEAGMSVRQDAAGNLIGRYEGAEPEAPAVLMGSHQDTVRNGGRYDGMLGIIAPIAAVSLLQETGKRLPHAIEVIAFTDEEGVRFGTTLLGSKALTGRLSEDMLSIRDHQGISIREAMESFGGAPDRLQTASRDPASLLAFVETHIEQGPQLQAANQPLGVVTAIAGGARLRVTLTGHAGHAGTVPMTHRSDALCCAAEAVLAIEAYCRSEPDLVGTVGQIDAQPGAINVIPGSVTFTADIRAPIDEDRRSAIKAIVQHIEKIALTRGIDCSIERIYDADGCACDPGLVHALRTAAQASGHDPLLLYSGAGHDTMEMARITPACMLFVRCRDGISHHPDESITAADAEAAARTLAQFLAAFTPR